MLLIVRLIDLYSLVVLVAIVLSWARVDRRHPLVSLVDSLTEPVLGPIRRTLPPMGGLDFSPMVLLLVLQVFRDVLR